jgi:hypothetical protein
MRSKIQDKMRYGGVAAPITRYLLDRVQFWCVVIGVLSLLITEGPGQRRWERWLESRHGATVLLNGIEAYTLFFGIVSVVVGVGVFVLYERSEKNVLFLLLSFALCILQPSYGSA